MFNLNRWITGKLINKRIIMSGKQCFAFNISTQFANN